MVVVTAWPNGRGERHLTPTPSAKDHPPVVVINPAGLPFRGVAPPQQCYRPLSAASQKYLRRADSTTRHVLSRP